MAKSKAKFVCQNCGTSYVKWAGRCENCGEWNTLLEQEVPTEAEAKSALSKAAVSGKNLSAVSINEIEPSDALTVTASGYSGTYDGQEHNPSAAASVPYTMPQSTAPSFTLLVTSFTFVPKVIFFASFNLSQIPM